jgi:preprotein translocase subunit YajC
LKRGDEIVTAGGLVGEVVHIKETTAGKPGMDDRITIKTGESRVVVERGRIVRVVSTTGATSSAPPSASNV